jgi:hypothetical protein
MTEMLTSIYLYGNEVEVGNLTNFGGVVKWFIDKKQAKNLGEMLREVEG